MRTSGAYWIALAGAVWAVGLASASLMLRPDSGLATMQADRPSGSILNGSASLSSWWLQIRTIMGHEAERNVSQEGTSNWIDDTISLQPSMFLVENLRESDVLKHMEPILPTSFAGKVVLATELTMLMLFPMQRASIVSGKLALQVSRGLGWSANLGRSGNLVLQSKLVRAVTRPVVSVAKTVRSIYKNRSKLSVVSEITYYADLPPQNASTEMSQDEQQQEEEQPVGSRREDYNLFSAYSKPMII